MNRTINVEDIAVLPPVASPQTIGALVECVRRWDASYSELGSRQNDLVFQPDTITYNSISIPMSDESRKSLFNKVGAPEWYLQKHSAQFQRMALTEHNRRGDFGQKPILVMKEEHLVTVVKGELIRLANADVIRAVQEGLGNEGDRLSVTQIGSDPETLDVELVSPTKAISVRPGDIVQSGLHIVHQRFGTQATIIESFIYRLICSNGMTLRECGSKGMARTRKLPQNFSNGREMQMEQIRRLTQHHWQSLQPQLEALRATNDRTTDVGQLLRRWLERARIAPATMMDRLLAAWRDEGSENTYYGAINAITRVATHHHELSQRQRRTLGSLAGILAFSAEHICEKCFSVLARDAADYAP